MDKSFTDKQKKGIKSVIPSYEYTTKQEKKKDLEKIFLKGKSKNPK